LALPLLVGDRLLGVLDIQSIHFEAFSDEDLAVMASLADQVAITLDDSRLLKETKAALVELENAQHRYLRQAWKAATTGPQLASAYVYTDSGNVSATSVEAARSPEIAQAAVRGQAVISAGDQSTLALPITLRGQVIGAIDLSLKPGRSWQPEQIEALNEISERLGMALEAARLSNETQQRVSRERFIREITDQIQRAPDMPSLMRITAEELNKTLASSRVYLWLGTENGDEPN
jgi:GAF domain-containing protein